MPSDASRGARRIHAVPAAAIVALSWQLPAATAQCTGDIDADGEVGVIDLLDLLGQWGTAGSADLNDDGQVGVIDLLTLLGGWGPCPAPPNTIVVYNLNYPDTDGSGANDAQEIAEYYVAARSLDPSSLCGVQLPPGGYATPQELLGARKTIVEDCICRHVAGDVQDATGCDVGAAGALEAIRDASPITHMVIIRGIPLRLFGLGWPDQGQGNGDSQGPSFDFYLSYLIYNDVDIFADNSVTDLLPYSLNENAEWGYVAPLDPAVHRMLAYGRVEAITKDRTLDLIDRTLAAERLGAQGNFLIELADPFLFDLASARDDVCFGYLSYEPFVFGARESSWPHEICRVGSTASTSLMSNPGTIPAQLIDDSGNTVPFAINAGLLYGLVPAKFKAFEGFENMLNWHKSDPGCVELCRDLPTVQEQDACRDASTDYFQEINTDCVGAAPGFMAFQQSSFSVQYYGFVPAGWGQAKGSAKDHTPPVVIEGDAYVDAQFTDDRYAHYGAYDHENPDSSTCLLADGTTAPCPSHIAVSLGVTDNHEDVFAGDSQKLFNVKLRYRYADPGGQPAANLLMRLKFFINAGPTVDSTIETVPLTDSAGAWNTATVVFPIGPLPGLSIVATRILLWCDADDSVNGFLDLDGVELLHPDTGVNMFPLDIGSFAVDSNESTAQGDWASNVIDRLGGIACWGHASHHNSNVVGSGSLPGAFYSGRTLGEAMAHANIAGGSGLFFGDPLYRPSAVKIHGSGFTNPYQDDQIGDPAGYYVWLDTYQAIDLKINAVHGTDNLGATRWELLACPELGIDACEGLWSPVQEGIGAVEDYDIGSLDDFIADPGVDQVLTLKLRVFNEGDEFNDLSNYAYFRYLAHPFVDCPGDANHDGVVDELDETMLLQFWGPEWFCGLPCPVVKGFCIADVDQDGNVGASDLAIIFANFGPCKDPANCPEDINGDGTVDQMDVDLVNEYWGWGGICPLPYEDCPVGETGFCELDLDQDGDVDGDDHDLLLNDYWGPCRF